MSEEEKKPEELTEEEKRALERQKIYEKQQAKVEKVAKDENVGPKKEEEKKPVVEEAPVEENFEEQHVDHIALDEATEEKKMKAKDDYTGADIEILQGLEAVRQRLRAVVFTIWSAKLSITVSMKLWLVTANTSMSLFFPARQKIQSIASVSKMMAVVFLAISINRPV